MAEGTVEEFEARRPRMFGLAYRMLGSAEDAEDVVQDAFLRWSRADHAAVAEPSAWLARVVSNLCLNRLASARARRERYVGPWLPEPVLTADGALGPLDTVEQRDSVSMALLVLLERLAPTERAAYVLREAFGHSHREIAAILGTTETNARQIHRRAAARVADDRSRARFRPDRAQWRRLIDRFLRAAGEGDLAELERMLADDAVSWSDGGGKATAGRRPVIGRQRVARLFGRGYPRYMAAVAVSLREVNGVPALVGRDGDSGALVGVLVPEVAEDRVTALRSVLNPDKLRYLRRQLDGPASPAPVAG